MTDRLVLIQLVRYGLVGLASNAALYVAYLLLTAAGLEAKLTMTLLYITGVAQTFIFNKRWTFGHDGASRTAFVRYCTAYAIGYVVNLLALYVLVDRAGYRHQVVQGVMIVTLAILLFLLQKYWVFGTSDSLSTSRTVKP